MSYLLEKYDYKNVLYYFEQLTKIPHDSGNVKEISDYLVSFAKKQGIRYIQDEALNVIMFKEASAGYEDAPTVMIQGHMDMVGEKEPDSKHDFKKDPLDIYVEDGYIRARGTTLGGDDGIAVAYGMALIADDTIPHPALEVVITTNEETGMDGAIALDTSVLKSEYMLNIDSEDEDFVICSCAGGLSFTAKLPVQRTEVKGIPVHVEMTGLQGGHSGAEIHKNRLNATKTLGRLLFAINEEVDFDLVSMRGGNKDNAIPRFADAELVIAESDKEAFLAKLAEVAAVLKKEHETREPGLTVNVKTGDVCVKSAFTPASYTKMMFLLINTPDGVQTMSADFEGLVESSLNMGIFHTEEDKCVINFSIRSSKGSAKHFICDRLMFMTEFAGGEGIIRGEYPAWEYRKESKLRKIYGDVYKEVYGRETRFEALHAGLECGLIGEKMPELDMISIGPEMHDIHTPSERLGIESSVRMYKLIEKVLEAIKTR